ncbi:MAG: signal peptidase I, partial [Pseudomonadales bacterium]
MNIDFPLLLTIAVLLTGLIWLLDVFVLKPSRASADSNGEQSDEDEPDKEPLAVEYARSFFPVLLIVWALRSFLAEPFQIPSESMVPTLEVGDFVLVNKYAYGIRLPVLKTKLIAIGEPARGDVMVFIPPHKNLYLIKRVVGLPGDVIRYANQSLTVNGEPVGYDFVQVVERDAPFGRFNVREYEEQLDGRGHLIHRYPPDLIRQPPAREWIVPAGSYFMLGDNRDRSEDSRVWGYASDAEIVGKAVAVWMHKEPGWNLPTFAENRWLSREADAE